MARTEPIHHNDRFSWRQSGRWLVILAIGLAVLGMILAIQQSGSLSHILQAQAQHRAVQIANDVQDRFDRELDVVVKAVASCREKLPGNTWQAPEGWAPWIDGLYLWDAQTLRVLEPPEDAPADLELQVVSRLSTKFARAELAQGRFAEGFLRDIDDRHATIFACRWVSDNGSVPVLAVARILLERLRQGIIEPLISPSDGLELTDAVYGSAPWSQPMFGVASSWAIRPTAGSLREQRNTIIWQTLGYLSLTILALATLLVAMWYLQRLARREVALAEMKANFVADVSHELKTPLATIQLFSETLQSGRVKSEEKQQEYYATIIRETTRLTNLINNILDFSRIEAGRREFALASTDIGRVIRDTYEAYRPQLDHKQFEHHLTIEDGLPRVDADRDAISRVLLNLMGNAVKYSGDERYLAIEVACDTQRDRDGVLVSVHDHGIGIRPEDHGQLFEGFFRAADDRVRERGGTGLGLALVKRIVDAHHGSVHVEPRLVKGTTFRVFLPASENVDMSDNQSR